MRASGDFAIIGESLTQLKQEMKNWEWNVLGRHQIDVIAIT